MSEDGRGYERKVEAGSGFGLWNGCVSLVPLSLGVRLPAGALPECYLITNHYHGRTGRATFELTPFTHVLGLDPSENIVRSAREALKRREPQVDDTYDVGSGSPQSQRRTIEFVQSLTESPDFIADESVDLVIAAAFPSLLPVLCLFPHRSMHIVS